jgi:hypothetical protein
MDSMESSIDLVKVTIELILGLAHSGNDMKLCFVTALHQQGNPHKSF